MFCRIDSPIGALALIWGTDTKVTALCLPGSSAWPVGEGTTPEGAAAELVRRINEYFSGKLVLFPRELFEMPGSTPVARQIYERVFAIPHGKTETYGQIAKQLGKAGGARAVGNAMARNPLPIIVPCHRVLASNSLGGFSSGLDHKRYLLKLEGVLLFGS